MGLVSASTSRYALLGLLTAGERTGYELRAEAEASVGHFWREGYGRIYPTLRQLAEEGLVSTRTEPGRAGPARHVHALTEPGWRELRSWLARPVEPGPPPRDELLLKLFLGRHAGPGDGTALLRERRELVSASLERYRAIFRALEGEPEPDRTHWRITVRHGELLARAALAWCDESIGALERLEQVEGP